MEKWKKLLKADSIDWLLEKDNPSVRYYTLVEILEKSLEDPEVNESKKQIMKTGVVPKILEEQKSGGYWFEPENFYGKRKYKGTVWNFIILAEVGADKEDKRIKKTAEFIFNNSQDPKSGGFAHRRSQKGKGIPGMVVPCLTGNMAWCMIRFGYLDDPRLKKAVEWITKYQRFDDKDQKLPDDFPYKSHKSCFGKHSCHMGAVKALKALAEIPENKRNDAVKKTIDKAVEYLLIHHIYKRSHDLSKVSKPSWLQLGFPHMYQNDILEILDILTRLGVKDKRTQDAIDIVVSKQNNEGKWILENTFNGKFLTNIEQKDKPSKWITLNAITTLKRYYN